MRMLARCCTTSVSCFRGVPELRLEHYQVGVSDGMLSLREMCFRIKRIASLDSGYTF